MDDSNRSDNRLHCGISHLAVTWVLMIPLIYFASRGCLWFQSVYGNNLMNARYGALATYSGTGKGIFVAVPVYAIVVIALFTRLRAVLACFHKHWPFSALALLSLASFAWSQFPIRSLEFSLLLTLDTLFAFYFCLRFSQDGQMRLLLIVGWMCLLFSIALSLFFPKFGMDYTEGVAGNWRGMYDHKNTCAMMTTFLLSPALFVKTGSLLGSVGRIIYVFLSVALIVMTQSRTGWILVFCLFICAGICDC